MRISDYFLVSSVLNLIECSLLTDMTYQLGHKVLTDAVNLHIIWYGEWQDYQIPIVEDFLKGLGASDWMKVTTQYYFRKDANSPKQYVNGGVNIVSQTQNAYSGGHILQYSDPDTIINKMIKDNTIKVRDSDVVLFLLSTGVALMSADQTEIFIMGFCPYHSGFVTDDGKTIYTIIAGNAIGNLVNCACRQNTNLALSPNGQPGIDVMRSNIAGQIVSVITNPDIYKNVPSWQDAEGDDVFLKCKNDCPNIQQDDHHVVYNVQWNNRKYLLQGNWEINGNSESCIVPSEQTGSPSSSSSASTKRTVSSASSSKASTKTSESSASSTKSSQSSISSGSSSKSASSKSSTSSASSKSKSSTSTASIQTTTKTSQAATKTIGSKGTISYNQSKAETVFPTTFIAVITMICSIMVLPMFWSN